MESAKYAPALHVYILRGFGRLAGMDEFIFFNLVERRRGTSASPWTAVLGGCTHGFVGGMKFLLLLAVLQTVSTANPWIVEFGGCTFSGDYDGAPLVRTGSCPTAPDATSWNFVLDLRYKGITSVQTDSFQGMSNLW
jgi:hypothetical protein